MPLQSWCVRTRLCLSSALPAAVPAASPLLLQGVDTALQARIAYHLFHGLVNEICLETVGGACSQCRPVLDDLKVPLCKADGRSSRRAI